MLKTRLISVGSIVALSTVTRVAAAQPAPGEPAKPADPVSPTGSSALTPPETPPSPPAAGGAKDGTTVPPIPKAFADEAALALRDGGGEPVAGWHGFFFLREPEGNFRISPSGDLMLDFNAWAGPGVSTLPNSKGGQGLTPRFFARRLRFGVHGDFLKRWSFAAAFDVSQGISNASGTDEIAAAPPAVDPTGDSARFRPTQGVDGGVGLRDIWVNYSLCPCLNFQVGQFQPPVSMESRTSDTATPLMSRSLATTGLVMPGQREAGLMLWGDFGDDVFTYELAVLGGDGQNRFSVDVAADFVGRLLVAPLKSVKLLKDARIGVSARHGQRDAEAVGYDVVPFMTNGGFVLWDSVYRDSFDRRTHVIPSGAQNLIGGELYLPIGPVDIATQGYYAAYHTREAIEGYQLAREGHTERLGALTGVALTSWVTWWAFGDERIGAAVGRQKPSKLNLKKKADLKRGLEVTALFSAILGGYDGNSRGGEDDPATPGSAGNPATDLDVFQFAGALSYWHTRGVRLSFNYGAYFTPGSGSDENLAGVAGNLGDEASPDNHLMHEFATRVQLAY